LVVGQERAGRAVFEPIPRITWRLGSRPNEFVIEGDRAVDHQHTIVFENSEELCKILGPVQPFIPEVLGSAKGWVNINEIDGLIRNLGLE
jgi:hypothetical protein